MRASAILALVTPAPLANIIPQHFSEVAPLSGLVKFVLAASATAPEVGPAAAVTSGQWRRHLCPLDVFRVAEQRLHRARDNGRHAHARQAALEDFLRGRDGGFHSYHTRFRRTDRRAISLKRQFPANCSGHGAASRKVV